MRIKIAFVVLFTAWFSSQALAQWNWQYPAPPPPPPLPPSVDQPDSLKSAPRQRRLSRPASREQARPAAGESAQPDARQRTAEEQKLRKEIQPKKRKSVAKQQKANKAAATGSVTSSSSAGKSPTKPRPSISAKKKSPSRPPPSASAGTKAPIKPTSQRRDVKETAQGTEPPPWVPCLLSTRTTCSGSAMTRQKIPQWLLFAIASDPTSLGGWKEILTRPGRIC